MYTSIAKDQVSTEAGQYQNEVGTGGLLAADAGLFAQRAHGRDHPQRAERPVQERVLRPETGDGPGFGR
jgi:hypothetical protein